MHALTFAGERALRVEQLPDPRIEQPGDAIVRVELAGVCGSDLHVYHGREAGLDPGTVMGHEFVGRVVEVGPAVQTIAVGMTVCSPFTTSCGNCFYCRRGLTARCEVGQLFGWVERGVGLQGCQAEQVRVPHADATLVPLPDGVAPVDGLLLGDVLPTGFFCAELAGAAAGRCCVVIGCGPVGLMAVASARRLGCERPFAVDLRPERLRIAKRFGASTLDAAEPGAVVAAVREATGGRGADAALEVVGSPEALRLAYDLVRPGGTIASVGVHTEPAFSISPAELYDKNLTLRSGRCPARHYMDRLLPWIVDGSLRPGAIVSHHLPLRDGARGYDLFDRKLDDCVKVVLSP